MSVKFELYTPETGQKETDVPTEYVRIEIPRTLGAPDVSFRPATDDDRDRHSAAYREFKKGQTVEVKDIPVAKLPEPPPDFMPGFVEPPPTEEPEHKEEHHHHSKKKHR